MDSSNGFKFNYLFSKYIYFKVKIFDKFLIVLISKPASHLASIVQNSSWQGVTGKVRFENNERLGQVHILQLKNGAYSKIGYFDSAEDLSYLQPLPGRIFYNIKTIIKFV